MVNKFKREKMNKKKHLLSGALLIALSASLAQAKHPVLLRIKNDTSDKILVVIKGHPTRDDIANAQEIQKGRAGWTIVDDYSRRGPFIIARAKDLKKHQISKLTDTRFTVAFKLPASSYIFPIGKYVFMGRGEEGAPDYGTLYNSIVIAEVEGGLALKAKRNFPIVPFWEKKWIKLERNGPTPL